MNEGPLLAFEQVRIDAGGAVLLEGLSFVANGPRVALAGEWGPFFSVLAGRAHVAAGSARLRGHDLRASVQRAATGLALSDAVLPEAWTARDYLEQSGELLGLRAKVALAAARATLAALGLAHLELRRLGTLTTAEKRAVLVAHARLGDPQTIVVEAPLDALDERSAAFVSEVLARASLERGLVASVPAPSALGVERGLLDGADDVVTLEAGMLVPALATGQRYSLTVTRNGSQLAGELEQRGIPNRMAPAAPAHVRLVVDLGANQTTDDLIDAALAAGAPLIELLPLGGGAGDER